MKKTKKPRKRPMHIELRIVLASKATATIKGTGNSIHEMKFTATGDQVAVDFLAELFADEHTGYTGWTGPWGGKIGKSLPFLLDVLDQESHDTPGEQASLAYQWIKQPKWPETEETPEPPEGVVQ